MKFVKCPLTLKQLKPEKQWTCKKHPRVNAFCAVRAVKNVQSRLIV